MSPAPLRIESIELFAIRLPLKETFAISYGSYDAVESVLVKLTAADGTVGWGEGTPDSFVTGETWRGVESALADVLAPAVLGIDARQRSAIHARMNAVLADAPSAKAAIDIAVHDLVGKASGLPVWALLGGTDREHLTVSRVVSMGKPEEMAAAALQRVAAGFRTIKLKVGQGSDIQRDIDRIAAVRAAVGPDIRIKIDVNQGWDQPATAIAAIRGSLAFDPLFFEQPIAAWNLKGMAEIRSATGAAVMIDEGCHGPRDLLRIIELGAADLLNIKLMKAGGLLPAVQMAQIAEAAGLIAQVGTMVESSIASAAGLHFALSQPIVRTVEMGGPMMLADDIGDVISWYQGAQVTLPSRPGIGVEPDEDRIRAIATRTESVGS